MCSLVNCHLCSFLCFSVCPFICLLATSRENAWRDLHNISRTDQIWYKEQSETDCFMLNGFKLLKPGAEEIYALWVLLYFSCINNALFLASTLILYFSVDAGMILSNALFCGRHQIVHPWIITQNIIDVYAQPSCIECKPDYKHN